MISRRGFLTHSVAGLAAGSVLLSGQNTARANVAQNEIVWHDVRDWGVEGKGWDDTERYFDRLPARAKGKVRPAVWSLSRHSAGMLVRFQSDATSIHAHYKVTSSNLAMPHMPATGVSGLDLYAEDDKGNTRWLAVTKPNKQEMKTAFISGIKPGLRTYTVYLPLYNGTEFLKIGVPAGTKFEPIAPREEKPLLFYGTSITHGACASRPGMPHPSILGRRFNRPIINLGFSGNGKLEKEVGDFLCEQDPAVYILDCLPNMMEKEVAERAEPFVRQLRKARPNTPILMVEDRTYPNSPFLPSRQVRHATSRAAFQKAYKNLLDAGFDKLGYIKGETLLGDDRDDTTDGSHPSDLGFYRHAEAFEPALRKLLDS